MKVLLIEDSADDRLWLRRLIGKDFELGEATSLAAGLRELEKGGWDAVLVAAG